MIKEKGKHLPIPSFFQIILVQNIHQTLAYNLFNEVESNYFYPWCFNEFSCIQLYYCINNFLKLNHLPPRFLGGSFRKLAFSLWDPMIMCWRDARIGCFFLIFLVLFLRDFVFKIYKNYCKMSLTGEIFETCLLRSLGQG